MGIAMGLAGTDVAKEAANMILLDDNFASIVRGIENGRLSFENLKKVVSYLLPAGSFSEATPIIANVFLGMPLPLSSFLMVRRHCPPLVLPLSNHTSSSCAYLSHSSWWCLLVSDHHLHDDGRGGLGAAGVREGRGRPHEQTPPGCQDRQAGRRTAHGLRLPTARGLRWGHDTWHLQSGTHIDVGFFSSPFDGMTN